MFERMTYDALVVGARCAGAAAAMLMARSGLRVLAIDRGDYGTDALSTHALMRAGVLQLHRWGVLPQIVACGTPPVRTAAFHYANEVTEVAVAASHGVEALYAPRRSLLDSALVDAARRAGAEVWHGHALAELIRSSDGRVRGAVIRDRAGGHVEIAAGLVVGADGVGSAVARLVHARVRAEGRRASAVVYGHWSGLAPTGYRWYYRKDVSAGVVPTNGERHCVFVAVPSARFRDKLRGTAGYHQVLAEAAPDVAAAMAAAKIEGSLRAFAGRAGYLREPFGPGWALVGDAGYFKDPLTAHGMTDALRDAELLARAAASGSDGAFVHYAAARDDLSLAFFEATNAIASFDWDLDAIKQHHQALNSAMKREVVHLAALDGERPEAEGGTNMHPAEVA